ncbi:MAG: site-specific integrase [Clostridiales bacterium]|nr:site-specific integrase [Clostridiales bacterium]
MLNSYNALLDNDLHQAFKYKAKPGIREVWKQAGGKYSDGIKRHTLTAILAGKNINPETAIKFTEIVGGNIDDLFEKTGEAKPLSENTVRHYLRCVSSVLSVAVEWQLIQSNPCERVRPPKVVQKSIKYLDIDDTLKIMDAAMTLDDIRIQTALLVFLYIGIRKGELTGLRWSDIDMEAQTITISRALQSIPGQGLVESDPKTDSGERMVSLSAGLIDQLRRYRTWQNEERLRAGDRWQWKEHQTANDEGRDWSPVDWVFTGLDGYPLHPATTYHKIKDFLRENSHPDMTVHGLRHSNISLMLSQGVDLITAARRAGHAKPSTTANIYAHALRRPDEAAADKLDSLLNRKRQAVEQ